MTPEEVRRVIESSVAVGLGVAIAVALVYIVLGLLTLAMRPAWLFAADLLVLGLVSLGVPVTIAGLLGGTAGPPAFLVPNLLLAILALALFAWMLVARIRVGPWGCRKTAGD